MPDTESTIEVRDFTPPNLPEIPDLAGLQKESFEHFLQAGRGPQDRAGQGLEELLRQTFTGRAACEYLGYDLLLGGLGATDCRRLGRTYGARLRIRLRRRPAASAASEDFVADAGCMPLMTERGTFIIEGEEKVVIGCLQAEEDTPENDLATRKLLRVGDLLRAALASAAERDATAAATAERPGFPALSAALRRFFLRSPYVKRAETRNPLALACQLRRVVQKGATRSPGYLARCTHPTHFGRLGLLETPEGDRIGINLSTAILARVDESGWLLAPSASPAAPGQVTYLSAAEETKLVFGDLTDTRTEARYAGGTLARVGEDLHRVPPERVERLPVHPQQALGVSGALIPFLAHDDANRALMGANMQKQAMPLLKPEPPLVRTGLERQVVRDMHAAPGWCAADGVLALGRNLLVAFLCWEGYNFEDGIVVSEEVVRQGLLDTVQTREYTVAVRKGAAESLTGQALAREGTAVSGGDILIGKTAVDADGKQKDTSLRVPAGFAGTVTSVEHYRAADGEPLADGVSDFVRIRLDTRRPLQVGDKLCTRHGAKGVVTAIVPTGDMPVLPDGRRVEVLMNPLGVPSRMNIGGLLETHMGLAARELGVAVVTPGFCGASVKDIEALLVEAGLPKSGMFRLRDGRTGLLFDHETTVGYLYMLRLDHMVADKRQERCIGPYDSETCQPVSGRRNGGGQRLGIMEIWALQGYGASHILHEMLTLKSDDVAARGAAYDALVEGGPLPGATVPESVKRLVRQLRGLCLDLQFLDREGTPVDVLAPGQTVANTAFARLQFASAERIRAWSDREVSGADLGDREGCIALAAPVKHAWRHLVPELETALPELTVLPVISGCLAPGERLDSAYAAVVDANRRCRESGAQPEAEALQGAVDTLLDTMTRFLYGKKGWITDALSGKTVDYSARSVVCPGPDLDYDCCSLPVATAAVLFEPMVVGELLRTGAAATRDRARDLLARRTAPALKALRKAAGDRYVLLHRAPALHRPSIQAFRVCLADEDVIRLHPLTLVAFNADFDGDEMDVYLPLSAEAQQEARERVLSSRSQLSPAHGHAIAGPSQDMVLGCYYATCGTFAKGTAAPRLDSLEEIEDRHRNGALGIHDSILFGERETTVGQALFNGILPPETGWLEGPTTKRELWNLLERTWRRLGADAAAHLADALMRFGFRHATLSGLSLGKDTLKQVGSYRKRLAAAWKRAERTIAQAKSPDEHHSPCSELAVHWVSATTAMTNAALKELALADHGMNSLHLMLASGARGSRTQVRQHIAMRGLMTLPDGRIMRSPITTNFLQGHTPLEYLASTYGARRGLADTALKVAEAGTIAKRIMNVVQDIVIVGEDCGCGNGIVKTACRNDSGEWFPLEERILGRILARAAVDPATGEEVLAAGQAVRHADVARLRAAGIESVCVRSPLTCRAEGGVCAACAGLDLTTWQPPAVGLPVGVIAAQSIGEPGTQLTMRTFYVAVPPKCDPATRRGRRPDIVGGLPRLRRLLEAWTGVYADDNGEREELIGVLESRGVPAAAEYLLVEMQKVYRAQGVRIDDRHFEILLARMLANGLHGISELAAEDDSFLVAGSAYGGTAALARSAAQGRRISLQTVRGSTLLGKVL